MIHYTEKDNMKKFKEFLENYDVYLDTVYTQKGMTGGKQNADERDDIKTLHDEERQAKE